MKYCVLDEEKWCDDCGECNRCDLNPDKLCDNCGKCIEETMDYKEILIDEILREKDYSKNDEDEMD